MKRISLLESVMILFSLVLATGCLFPLIEPVAEEADRAAATLNLVAAAHLSRTIAVEILERDETMPAFYVYRQTITDPAIIAQLVTALDVKLPGEGHVQCPAFYKLRFQLADGTSQEIAYACEHATPAFLHGTQAFWEGQAVIAPDEFNRVIEAQLDLSAVQQIEISSR